MKILHTDKDENPAKEIPAAEFINRIQQPTTVKEAVIDLGTGQPVAEQPKSEKKNNGWIWTLIAVLVLLLIAGTVYYLKLKAAKDEHSGN